MTRPTPTELKQRLSEHFPNADISIRDDSHLHAGHAGAQGGAGHYHLAIRSARFNGLQTVAKHRLVYDAVQDWMPDRVHALSIEIL